MDQQRTGAHGSGASKADGQGGRGQDKSEPMLGQG